MVVSVVVVPHPHGGGGGELQRLQEGGAHDEGVTVRGDDGVRGEDGGVVAGGHQPHHLPRGLECCRANNPALACEDSTQSSSPAGTAATTAPLLTSCAV